MNELSETWIKAWPDAIAAWSKYTRLVPATLCPTSAAASREGLEGSFAMIRFADQRVVIDLEYVHRVGLDDYATEILAHEIGHHVYAPANATDNLRLVARIRAALPTMERFVPLVANLYTDLLINDRLQRQSALRMADIYRVLGRQTKQASSVWTVYMRIYEHLWNLIGGIVNIDESESEDAVHPSEDPLITGEDQVPQAGEAVRGAEDADGKMPGDAVGKGSLGLQAREPYEYGEILKAAGIALSDHDIAIAYYRERALPHILPYPKAPAPENPDPLLEGLDDWGLGDPFDEIDYMQSLIQSPSIIPGLTTVKRVYGNQPGTRQGAVAVDLDIFIDSSGSMPNPQVNTSWLTLAGAIIALSALRAGARVQATLWSGKHQVTQTQGFVRDERQILSVLTDYFGGGTCFPIHCLRDTYSGPKPRERGAHILMISDDGITPMFDDDETGHSGWDVASSALRSARGGGTFALNLSDSFGNDQWSRRESEKLKRACDEQGWALYRITNWEELLDFARDFARRHRDGMIAATEENITR